ncbi:helix-turn-helix domain-containing protein [Heliorestis acidaminivorans]|uniref:Helix-turn-helix domain-containing protein n=1 Tax=Heliorestis acidaminivorans TaxID=553427 RepID=A0A6I0F2A8_9FIRM|nr:helix-turn-helix domain-containing protein [Heliorestis acidaminivorans]KAB2952386.1 helix-turn-helix domain-containing protein [Heliorestis acidaminivorans]
MSLSWIRLKREEKGLSLQELSRMSGVSVSYLSEIERGTKEGASKTVIKIASALGVPREEVMKPITESEIGLGQRIRMIREKKNRSLADLATAVGLEESQLIEIEKGETKPNIDLLRAIADELDITVSQLFSTLSMIATRLRTVREQSGLTQAELAEKAGVSPGLIGQLEQSKVQPSLRTIERVSEVLGVTPCYFLVPQPSLETLLPLIGDDLIQLLKEPKVQEVLRMIYDLREEELRFVFGVIRLLKEERPVTTVEKELEKDCC